MATTHKPLLAPMPQPMVLALALLALTVAYSTVCLGLVRTWSADPLYSYGFAVPLISGYVIATRGAQFRAAIGPPDYALGPLLVVLAGLLFVAGEVGTALRLQQLSLVVVTAGVALLLFGRQAFRHLWFAIAYLLLMVPVWTDLIAGLQVPSQIFSGRIALGLFHAIGFPALQEGTLIYLPRLTLEVLRECSGVNQLVAIFALTLPAAYLWITGAFRRALFVATSLLIGYLSNGARIALVGVLAQNGFDTTSPRIHLAEGLLVAMIGYGIIGAAFIALASARSQAHEPLPVNGASRVGPLVRRPWLDASLAIFVLACAAAGVLLSRTRVAPRADLQSLPFRIGDWTRDASWQPIDGIDGEADNEAHLTYRRTTGERVHLYIGYQQYQEAGKGLSQAFPKQLRGDESVYDVRVAPNLARVKQVHDQARGANRGAFYWFDVDGSIAIDRYDAKRHLLWNAITRGRTNGAVIVVSWEAPAGVDFNASRAPAVEFLRSLAPVLPDYLPSTA